MPTTRIKTIHKRIERIKADLVAIDEMRPGSVSKQFKNPELAQRGLLPTQLLTGREKSNGVRRA
jgi:hypothetical protein